MNRFINLKQYKRRREIALLYGENFCDFQLIRETIREFNYERQEIIFILHTDLLSDSQEQFLNSFLKNELGAKYKHLTYTPSEHYVRDGQECIVFTSDPTEKDIEQLNDDAKKILGWTTIKRRPTEEEIIKNYKEKRKFAVKKKLSNIGHLFLVIVFFSLIALGCLYLNNHDEAIYIIGAIIGIGFVLFLFFSVWSFVSVGTNKKWTPLFKSIGITLIIITALLLIGYASISLH